MSSLQKQHILLHGFQDLFNESLFSDVKVVFRENQCLNLHKLVLAASSDYLKLCLKDTENDENQTCLFLPDFDIDEFRMILPYLYGFSSDPLCANFSSDLVQSLQLGQTFMDFEEHDLKIEPFDCSDPWSPEIEEEKVPIISDSLHCFGCLASIPSFSSLQEHLNSSKKCSEKNFICPQCPKFFDTSLKVTRHKVVHKKDRTFLCDRCQKSFKSKKILITHQSKVHGIHPMKKFACPKCPHSFNFEKHLQAHLNKHGQAKKEPDLFCDHCDMICTNRSALNYHMQKHLKPNYPCTLCSKSFKSEFGLNYHLKIHNNEAHYLCDDCGKKFISPYKLIQHRRSKHTNERPFICEECGEGFVRNDKLTVHRRRAHTGERPYPCDLCEWRGVDSSSLIHHKKKHVKQKNAVEENILKLDI